MTTQQLQETFDLDLVAKENLAKEVTELQKNLAAEKTLRVELENSNCLLFSRSEELKSENEKLRKELGEILTKSIATEAYVSEELRAENEKLRIELGQMKGFLILKSEDTEANLQEIARLRAEVTELKEAEVAHMTELKNQVTQLKKENSKLLAEIEDLRVRSSVKGKAVLELADKLCSTKMETEELRLGMKENKWMPDKDSDDCHQCGVIFSVVKRKHHCRNCGYIFCNECSDNRMLLSSSAKLQRVCDACSKLLYDRPRCYSES